MPDTNIRARLDAAIDTLDDAQRQRLLDWAGSINRDVADARSPGSSIGPLADMLVCETEVTKQGRKVVFLESRVRDDNGKLVATASGSFAVIKQGR